MPTDFRKLYAIREKNKKKWLQVNAQLSDISGIYVLRREENGIKYGYVGQAVKILTRLADHLSGYQHIDLSIKNHGLYDETNNPTGWHVTYFYYPKDRLDEMEKFYIQQYANLGYQLRNKTSGGQGEGKVGIADNRPAKGYRDGIKQGEKNIKRELNKIIDKYLVITTKQDNKLSQRMLEKFYDLLSDDDKGGNDGQN